MPGMKSVAPEDDFRIAYEGAVTAEQRANDLDWLMGGEAAPAPAPAPAQSAAGGQQAAPEDGVTVLPEITVTGEETPPLPEGDGFPSAPEYMDLQDEEGSTLWDYAGEVVSAIPAIGKDVLRGGTEAVPQIFGGFVDALDETANALQSIIPMPGVQLFDAEGNFNPELLGPSAMTESMKGDKTLFDMIAPADADSVTGGLIRSTSQFLTGFLPGLKAAKALGMGKLAAGMTAGAIADAVVMDPHEARLSTFLNEVPGLQVIVPDYLAAHGEENESEWEGRLKNAIEGAGLGVFTDVLPKVLKYYKAQRQARLDRAPQDPKALAAKDMQEAQARAELGNDITDDMLAPLGDAADDAPLLIEAKPDETLTTALGRLREADARAAQMAEQGEALQKISTIIEQKKRKIDQTPKGVASGENLPAIKGGVEREPIDDALDELRSGAVSKARFPARPVAATVRDLGGIDPASSLAGDLRSRGITPKSFPGLFKRGGLQSLDNIPASEHPLFLERGRVSADGYVDEQAFIDAMEDELKGNPWRTAEQQQVIDDIVAPANELDEMLSRLGIDYENMSNDAVKARLKEIADEQEGWQRYQEEVASRIDAEGQSRTYAELVSEQQEYWSVEQVAEARAAGVDDAIIKAHEPPKVYVNLARIKGAEDIKAAIQALADADVKHIDEKRRGVVSNQQTIKESSKEYQDLRDLIGRDPGPMSAAQAVAARKLLASSAEQVTQLAKIASQPNAGKVDLYNFRRALSIHAAIQAEVIAARTETARALQSWAIPVGADKMRTDAINDLLTQYKGSDLTDLARMVSNVNSEVAVNAVARQTVGLSVRDALYSVYVNGLLSGPKTHLANTISNAATSLYALPERFVAERFSNAFGSGDVVRGESAAMAYGMIEGLRDGVRLMVMGPKAEGVPDLSELWEQFGKRDGRPNPISGGAFGLDPNSVMYKGLDVMGKIIGVPGSMLERSDLFFKAINYRMELHALAYREASLQGLEGKAFADKVADILSNPPANLAEQANKFALVQTFTNPLGEQGRRWQSAISNSPMRWAIPFVRTPTNIMKYAFARTPLAYTMSSVQADIAAGGARAAQAHARVALSTTLMFSFAGLAMDGVISGGGPLDPKQQAALRAQGWQPYSVKVGDKWYSYSRTDPLGMMLGMSADLAEISNSGKDVTSGEEEAMLFVAGITAFTQNLASKTYMQGAFELAAALDPRNPMSDPGQFLGRTAQGFMPYSAFLRQTTQAIDPTIRESRDPAVNELGEAEPMASFLNKLVNDYKRQIPGMSDTLPPVRDILGKPMTIESGVGWAWDALVPIATKTEKNDPLLKAIIDNEVKVSRPSRVVGGVTLNAEQYDELQVLAGDLVEKMLRPVVTSPGFKNMSAGPDGMQALLIKRQISAAHEAARNMILARDPALRDMRMQKMRRTGNALLGN